MTEYDYGHPPVDPFASSAWSPIPPPFDAGIDHPGSPDDRYSDGAQDHDDGSTYTEPSAKERAAGKTVAPKREAPSQSAILVEMARSLYSVVKSTEGKVYAVEHKRPSIALDLRGKAGLRQRLAKLYYDEKKRTPSDTALKEMLNVLEGDALTADEVPVFLRFGRTGPTIIIDAGTPEGNAVAVAPGRVDLLDQSPILFRRSSLISPMPAPKMGGNLDGFQHLVNASESSFRLLAGWLVAACIPDIPTLS